MSVNRLEKHVLMKLTFSGDVFAIRENKNDAVLALKSSSKKLSAPPPPPRVKCVLTFYIKYNMLIQFCKRFGPRSGPTKVGPDRNSYLIKKQQRQQQKSLRNHPVGKFSSDEIKRCTQLPWLKSYESGRVSLICTVI